MLSGFPLLSVVIPTRGRADWLQRAVDSALASAPEGDLEVLVVPNGPERDWVAVVNAFANEPRVKAIQCDRPNANSARNMGLFHARGKYVRFLDDDDRLDPANAIAQLSLMDSRRLECMSGQVALVEVDGTQLGIMLHADEGDLFCAMARPGRICVPTSHVFLRDSLKGFLWDEQLAVEQDTDWMFRLASQREWNWEAFGRPVGYWTQHGGQRVSSSITNHQRGVSTCRMLLRAADDLRKRNALCARRRRAIGEGLWENIHPHFYRAPVFWTRVIRAARTIDPGSAPSSWWFRSWLGRFLGPIAIEWLLLPKRWLNWLARSARSRFAATTRRPPSESAEHG